MKVPDFVWVAISDNGAAEPGIAGVYDGAANQWVPLVVLHERNVPSIEKMAKKIANDSGRKIRVHKFMLVEGE